MIKICTTFLFLLSISVVFSQETNKELTDEEKQALRDKHNSGVSFKTDNSKSTGNLNFTNSTEEKNNKTTVVKYYHGTQDTLYKEYKYTKPD